MSSNDDDKRRRLVEWLREIDGTGIVYAATIKQVETAHADLAAAGFKVAKYHGKLGARYRRDNQERFMSGDLKAIVATNAFGMGIDKADIRFVIHYAIPGSLEAYYQEAGRAGRDGEPARCILLFNVQDQRTHKYFIGGSFRGARTQLMKKGLERRGPRRRVAAARRQAAERRNQSRTHDCLRTDGVVPLANAAGLLQGRRHGGRVPLRHVRHAAANRLHCRPRLRRLGDSAPHGFAHEPRW